MVYIGPNSGTLLSYFERNGSRRCESKENPWVEDSTTCSFFPPCTDCRGSVEFILDVIGAGATATSTVDWHAISIGRDLPRQPPWNERSNKFTKQDGINPLLEPPCEQDHYVLRGYDVRYTLQTMVLAPPLSLA